MSGAKVIDPWGNDLADAFNSAAAEKEQPLATVSQYGAADQAMAEIITAQKVAVKRNLQEIANEFKALCSIGGNAFFYRWEVNDKSSKTGKNIVEGPSIDLAMALVGVYGNCRISATPARETPTHIVFAARFIDYEKGVTVERTFQQRKNQSLGMADKDRAADIVYQIGQSKAMRNAVVAALKTLADQGVEWAKKGIIKRVSDNPDGARGWLTEKLAQMDIPLANAEYVVAGKRDEWTPVQMARLFATIQSITDGYSTVTDEFPAPGQRPVDGDPPENLSNKDLEGEKTPVTKPAEMKKPAAKRGGGKDTQTPPAVGDVTNDTSGETGSQAGGEQTSQPADTSTAAKYGLTDEEVKTGGKADEMPVEETGQVGEEGTNRRDTSPSAPIKEKPKQSDAFADLEDFS